MIHPYEIVSKSALPAFRAMVSKRLTENYSLTQQEVAKRLGVTQASVSNYARKARGMMVDLEIDDNIAKAADRSLSLLASEKPDQTRGAPAHDRGLRLRQVQPHDVRAPRGAGAGVQDRGMLCVPR